MKELKKKYEGIIRRRIRKALEDYKHTKDLRTLLLTILAIGDKNSYAWIYYYKKENLEELFAEYFPTIFNPSRREKV